MTTTMTIDQLSREAQAGLREWAAWQHRDENLLDAIGGLFEDWAWICFQLRIADDRPEWFPKGKSATIQVIETWLYDEAERQRRV